MTTPRLLPPTLIYGSERPDIRLRSRGGKQVYFCRNNRNLYLTADDFHNGTYEAGSLLGSYCREFCLPGRQTTHEPCPAFVAEHQIGTENKGLASVELRSPPDWSECAGAKALLDMTETPEERFFLESYLNEKIDAEAQWRRDMVEAWNVNWYHVPEGWGHESRRGKFDRMLQRTLRFPALVPQVWLNWLHAASEEDLKILDDYPSRVDFVAFWNGEAHLIEIDGPSHYASYDENAHTYAVDERAYARNLRIARSLQGDGWNLTRIARIEIRDVMDDEWTAAFEAYKFLGALPFYNQPNPTQESAAALGLPELDFVDFAAADDDIPF